ncbi:amino acid ABC transporter ATP-binding protein [Marivirga tractuosa]|uniref:ABC transporter related protein n=1 Tax=Marivirga tractuosa (strain ATCC 23168 / DSM 4126 / NBRC 15989 / NCIMB 1408 / VKM B-1430 / H-43) TaxID=643867 RepID=E4TKJ5_MARTH|nr:ABC transporter ATP-binding protein [Marivirga tractuosa]ADR20175.1 ABC transporter related protein [Marivirga tractuosa DSM 4126]BDD15384.1 amino acid ABC transporter ATP-binding protein [Marivirga tractuosa]
MISFQNIEKSFDQQLVLKKINLEIQKGELMVLLGASGSGKTTMLRMINALEKPDSGSIEISNQNIGLHNILDLRKQIGYVIQKVGLFPHYSVYDNVATILRLKAEDEKSIKQKVHQWLGKIGMPASIYGNKYPAELSGGEAQRIGLARALVAKPKMILLDEPFSALDPISRVIIRNKFRKIQREEKLTAVMVTHDVLEAVSMADRICLLANGEIQQVGTPQEIIFHPKNDWVAKFIKGDQFQASLASVSLNEIQKYIKGQFFLEDNSDNSVLDFLQYSDSKFHSIVLDAFYNWKEDKG